MTKYIGKLTESHRTIYITKQKQNKKTETNKQTNIHTKTERLNRLLKFHGEN